MEEQQKEPNKKQKDDFIDDFIDVVQHKELLSKILGIDNCKKDYSGGVEECTPASWAEIYIAIGKLQERASPPLVRTDKNSFAPQKVMFTGTDEIKPCQS